MSAFLCTAFLLLLSSCVPSTTPDPDAIPETPDVAISSESPSPTSSTNNNHTSVSKGEIETGLIFNSDTAAKGTAQIDSFNDGDSPYSQLLVTLGDGTELTKIFDGVYYPRISVGNLDDEIDDEIAVFLEAFGSNYGGGTAIVLKIKENEIVELHSPYEATNEDGFSFTIIDKNLNDGVLIAIDGSLKLYEFIKDAPSRYLSMRLDGSNWRIFSAGYGNPISGVEDVNPDLLDLYGFNS